MLDSSRFRLLPPGLSISIRYFDSKIFCLKDSALINASYLYADQAPGSTYKKLKKDSKFLSRIWEESYS